MVDRHDVEDQLGRDRQRVLPLERQVDQRRRGGEPLVPAAERIGDRALDDGGADDGAHDAGLAHHQLVAHALGVGVDVGPAPGRGPLDPLLGHLGADPLLARAGDGQLQRRLVVGIAVLLAQPRARLLAQPRQHLRVVGQLADAHRARPRCRRSPARRRTWSPTAPCGAGSSRPAPRLSQTSPERFPATKQVLVWISAGRFIRLAKAMTFLVPSTLVRSADSSGGLNVTRPDELMRTSMSLATFSASASERPRFGSVMSPSTTTTFCAQHRRQPLGAAVLVAQRIEGRRGHHALPEPRLAVGPRAAAHHDVGPPDVRKPVAAAC